MILGLIAVTVPGIPKTTLSEAHITVRVMDYVNLRAAARAELEATTQRILRQAGVAVEFIDCLTGDAETNTEACRAPLGPTDFALRILQPKFVLRILRPKLAMRGEQLGYAAMTPEGGAYITVFICPEQQKARVSNLSNGPLLGHAVAHEIGHLLLGPNAHSATGIMRPVWRPVDEEWMEKGVLLFDEGQANKMRSALAARLIHKAPVEH